MKKYLHVIGIGTDLPPDPVQSFRETIDYINHLPDDYVLATDGFDTTFSVFEAASIAHTCGKPIVAADQLGSGQGQVVGFVEGRTAASPFWPGKVPVDAYCALIADGIDYRPPGKITSRKAGS